MNNLNTLRMYETRLEVDRNRQTLDEDVENVLQCSKAALTNEKIKAGFDQADISADKIVELLQHTQCISKGPTNPPLSEIAKGQDVLIRTRPCIKQRYIGTFHVKPSAFFTNGEIFSSNDEFLTIFKKKSKENSHLRGKLRKNIDIHFSQGIQYSLPIITIGRSMISVKIACKSYEELAKDLELEANSSCSFRRIGDISDGIDTESQSIIIGTELPLDEAQPFKRISNQRPMVQIFATIAHEQSIDSSSLTCSDYTATPSQLQNDKLYELPEVRGTNVIAKAIETYSKGDVEIEHVENIISLIHFIVSNYLVLRFVIHFNHLYLIEAVDYAKANSCSVVCFEFERNVSIVISRSLIVETEHQKLFLIKQNKHADSIVLELVEELVDTPNICTIGKEDADALDVLQTYSFQQPDSEISGQPTMKLLTGHAWLEFAIMMSYELISEVKILTSMIVPLKLSAKRESMKHSPLSHPKSKDYDHFCCNYPASTTISYLEESKKNVHFFQKVRKAKARITKPNKYMQDHEDPLGDEHNGMANNERANSAKSMRTTSLPTEVLVELYDNISQSENEIKEDKQLHDNIKSDQKEVIFYQLPFPHQIVSDDGLECSVRVGLKHEKEIIIDKIGKNWDRNDSLKTQQSRAFQFSTKNKCKNQRNFFTENTRLDKKRISSKKEFLNVLNEDIMSPNSIPFKNVIRSKENLIDSEKMVLNKHTNNCLHKSSHHFDQNYSGNKNRIFPTNLPNSTYLSR